MSLGLTITSFKEYSTNHVNINWYYKEFMGDS